MPVSAKTGQGNDGLLTPILAASFEVLELGYEQPAKGVVIEAAGWTKDRAA
jgi:translation initiation factor IF-2